MADDNDLVERTGTMDGKPFKIRVNKNLTDDEIKRRISAQRMQPSQTDFGTDVGYGIVEGLGGMGAKQLGEEIAKKAGVIPQAPEAPKAEGVVSATGKVKSGETEGLTPGRLIGNVMGGAGMGGAIGKGLEAVTGLGSMSRNVAAGAIPAALQPVEGEGDYWSKKRTQVETGVGLGYGFSVLGKAANVGTSALLKWLAPRAPGSTDDVAIQQILDRINMGSKYGGPTAQQMMELMERAQAAGKPMTMADVGDKNLVSLGGHVARGVGPGRQIAENFLTTRNEAAFDRLLNDTGVYLKGGPSAYRTVEGLYTAREAAARPLYEETDKLQGVWSPRLEEFIRTKPETPRTPANADIQEGLNRGYKSEARRALGEGRPFDPTMLGVDLDNDGNVRYVRTPNMRVLDMVKQGLDEMIAEHRDKLTGRLDTAGRDLVILRKGYLSELDALDPTGIYKKAREAWGGISASMDAVKFGQNAFSGNPEEIADMMQAMSSSDQEFARVGLADTIRERLAKSGLGTDQSRAIFKDNAWTRSLLKPFFRSDQDYYNFVDAVTAEHTMAATKNFIVRGSQSAERIQEDVSAQSGMAARMARFGRNFVEMRYFDAIREAWLMHRDYTMRPDPQLNEAIAKMLFAPNVFQTPMGKRLLAQSGMPPVMQNYLSGTPSRIQDVLEPAVAGGVSAPVAAAEGREKPKRSVVRRPELTEQ